eukprot:3274962-Rhodomonas_salina.2
MFGGVAATRGGAVHVTSSNKWLDITWCFVVPWSKPSNQARFEALAQAQADTTSEGADPLQKRARACEWERVWSVWPEPVSVSEDARGRASGEFGQRMRLFLLMFGH